MSRRLGYDMTTAAPDHASHDPLLIAAHLDGTLDAREAIRVHDWLGGCGACITLRSDLAALATATRAMSTPVRPRDFMLTVADAERARGRRWRRALGAIASPRDSFSRPLAIGLTTLGLAGLVVAFIPSASLFGSATSAGATGASAGAPQQEMSGTGSGPASEVPALVAPNASPLSDASVEGGAQASPPGGSANDGAGVAGRDSDKQAGGGRAGFQDPDAGPAILVVVSLVLLLTGSALALLRWAARRLGDG